MSTNKPSGIGADLLQESKDGPAITAILFITSFVSLLMVVRLYARYFFVKSLGLDDWLAMAAMVGHPKKDTEATQILIDDVRRYLFMHLRSWPSFSYIWAQASILLT